jgi:hypothetical protein
MKIQRLTQIALAALLATAAGGVQACGEVMYRMGGALHYRAFVTRHPARILLYSNAAPSADTDKFHQNLEKAGHKVTVIHSADEFSHALVEQPYDVIIAYAADLPMISGRIDRAAHETSLIPVFGRDDRPERQQYPLALTEDANLNDFLKTIEKSMRARGT